MSATKQPLSLTWRRTVINNDNITTFYLCFSLKTVLDVSDTASMVPSKEYMVNDLAVIFYSIWAVALLQVSFTHSEIHPYKCFLANILTLPWVHQGKIRVQYLDKDYFDMQPIGAADPQPLISWQLYTEDTSGCSLASEGSPTHFIWQGFMPLLTQRHRRFVSLTVIVYLSLAKQMC